jgi:hypothetical protein
MSNQNYDDQPIDPDLSELLSLLQSVPARDPEAAQRGRAKYISEIETLLAAEKSSVFAWFSGLFTARGNTGRRGVRFAYSTLVAILAVIFVLLSGAGATAYAAKSALPGDVLYQVKTGLEQAQMQLTSDANRRAQLHLEFAERRLEEIAGLIDEGRFSEIDRAAGEFEVHVQMAIRAMQIVSNGNPEQASQLATQIANALSRYNLMLSEMLDQIPEEVRSSVERAILTSRYVGEGSFGETNENSNGNLNENVNSNEGGDHSNTNGNQNEDDGVNSNDNENENNGNENEGNGNENLNSNHNTNRNDNTNQNDNDSGNNNENSNEEPKNDNGNDNNDNDNHNDNGSGGGGNDNDDGNGDD